MKNKQRSRTEKAARAIDEYFEEPDPERDLEELFSGVNRTTARGVLADRLRTPDVEFFEFELFVTLFDYFGVDDQFDNLCRIVADRTLSTPARAIAVAILDNYQGGSGSVLLTDGEDREAVLTVIWHGLMLFCMQSADAVEAVTQMLAAVEDDVDLFRFVDRIRRDSGAPAALIYDEALSRPGKNPMREAMVEALLEEPSLGSVELLDRLAGEPLLEPSERLYRGAAMRIRTKIAAASAPSGERGGALSVVDRDGGIIRFWFVAAAGNLVCVDVLFEVGGRIKLPMIMPQMPRSEFQKGRGEGIAEVPFAQAASVFLTMLNTHDDPLDRSATALAKTIVALDPLPRADAAAEIDGGELATLMHRGEYDGWHLLPEVERDEEFDPFARGKRHKQQFIKRLAADDALLADLVWMCDWMSRWHFAHGEQRESAIMARLSLDVRKNFSKSALANLLLERTIEILRDAENEIDEESAAGETQETDFEDEPSVFAGDPERVIREVSKVVANQLRANKPPITRRTLDRLKAAGYGDKEAKRMLAEALAVEMAGMVKFRRPYDEERLTRRFDALPETLEW